MEKEKKGIKKAKKKVTVPETGQRIKERRRKLHMTQEQLAEAVYMNPKTISAIENGRRNPSLETVEFIAKILDVDRDYLLGKIDFPSIEEQRFGNYVKMANKYTHVTDLCEQLFCMGKYNVERVDMDIDVNFFENTPNNPAENQGVLDDFFSENQDLVKSYEGLKTPLIKESSEILKEANSLIKAIFNNAYNNKLPTSEKTTVYALDLDDSGDKSYYISESAFLRICQQMIDYGDFLLEHEIRNSSPDKILHLPKLQEEEN